MEYMAVQPESALRGLDYHSVSPSRGLAITLAQGTKRLSTAATDLCRGFSRRLSATGHRLAGQEGVAPRLVDADGRGVAVITGSATMTMRRDAVGEAMNPKTGLGLGGGVLVAVMAVGLMASSESGGGDESGEAGGGSDEGPDRHGDDTTTSADRERNSDSDEPSSYLEGPLDTGLPGDFDTSMDPNGDYLPGDPAAEYAIRTLRENGWQVRFTDPGTIPGDSYMDWENTDENGLRTLWLSTDLMNLPPDELLAAIAKAID
jgi:hypothetical protein